MNSLTDNALMLKVKAGDTHKLGLLYERYKKWVFNFFNQMYQDAELSEDLVQNVFMRILKYKHTYTEESKFVTWMFQIARNESHDHYNKRVKNKKTVDIDTAALFIETKDEGIIKMEERETHDLLYKAIDRLPIEKKEIIVLSKLKQLRYTDIAVILDCNEEAARTRSHRALKDLKKIYFELQKVS